MESRADSEVPGPAVFSHSRLSPDTAAFPSRTQYSTRPPLGFDGRGEGRVLLLSRSAPSLPLDTAVFSRWTVERRVWSYGVWYCCAPSLPLDTAAPSRSDGGVEDMFLRGLVL